MKREPIAAASITLPLWSQRVYGITFPDKKQLAEHLERLAEAKKRDHRVVGTQMELFMFDKLSPGSCFFMPNGACIYNALVEVRTTSDCGSNLQVLFDARTQGVQ